MWSLWIQTHNLECIAFAVDADLPDTRVNAMSKFLYECQVERLAVRFERAYLGTGNRWNCGAAIPPYDIRMIPVEFFPVVEG